ncbi:ferritin-like protein [Streptomyces sp. NPDC100445]|uniref:ferritin-like domain-containing protein n=1 Tax=Streptomyces sp. NPDC100445 TaxID=3366102 RepID=UPI003802E160
MTGTTEDPHGAAAEPLGRRTFLASAALAAAAQVPAADPARAADPDPAGGPGQTGGLPECGPPARPGCRSVAGLLAVPRADRGVAWLRQALEAAVALELATLPPYLCAWWSVRDRRSETARLIRRVIGDEMYHLGVVCNLLVAVGGRPRIREAAPTYPGPLPGGVRGGLKVYLSGLTRTFVHDVMMAIEAPDTPLARTDRSPSIGDFYGDLGKAFREAAPELSARGQLSSRIGSDELTPVKTLDDVERCLEIVKEQGEGTESSPADSFQDDHPAHYYAFAEIYHGRQLRPDARGWSFTGASVPFPDARPMARVPAGGWPHPAQRVRQLLDRFDDTYATVLDKLEAAWSGGGQSAMGAAVHAMRAMEEPAVELMEITIPDAPGNYGPQFRRP